MHTSQDSGSGATEASEALRRPAIPSSSNAPNTPWKRAPALSEHGNFPADQRDYLRHAAPPKLIHE